jgi:hypothetical protein
MPEFGISKRLFRSQPVSPKYIEDHNALIGQIADMLREKYPEGVPNDPQMIADKINFPVTAINFGDVLEAIEKANAVDSVSPKKLPLL